jgi:signal peptidase I
MLPTFQDGEQIIAEKVSVRFEPLKRSDIAIFKHPANPDKLVIKRVVGLPGDSFELISGKVFIDGQNLSETYLTVNMITQGGKFIKENTEYKIPSDSYIFLGDNRLNSRSRDWGLKKI